MNRAVVRTTLNARSFEQESSRASAGPPDHKDLLVAERSGEIATTRDLTIQMLPKDGGPASLRGSWYTKPASH